MIYKILEAGTIEELERQVNEKLNDGWQLNGGMTLHPWSSFYAQAIVNHEMISESSDDD